MTTPARVIYAALGRPAVRDQIAAHGPCYWCGEDCDGAASPQATVCGGSFTDQHAAQVPWSEIVCAACSWCFGGSPPNTYRNWSAAWSAAWTQAPPDHPKVAPLIAAPGVHLQNKADLSAHLSLLLSPPPCDWFVSLADTGQIHTLPYTPMNHGDGWQIRLERDDIRSDARTFGLLLHDVASAYAAGFGTEAIATGEPHPTALLKAGVATWRRLDAPLQRWRGGALMRLALFFIRKDKGDELVRLTQPHADAAGRRRPLPAAPPGLPPRDGDAPSGIGSRPDSAPRPLDAPAERPGDSGGSRPRLAADGVGDGAKAPDPHPPARSRQLGLFDGW
jgi:hypothetical protein